MSEESKNKPVHTLRVGKVKAMIWANENGPKYKVTFALLYKDGDEWKETHGYDSTACLQLAKAADMANSWIVLDQSEQDS